jgi:hypothetical protein
MSCFVTIFPNGQVKLVYLPTEPFSADDIGIVHDNHFMSIELT